MLCIFLIAAIFVGYQQPACAIEAEDLTQALLDAPDESGRQAVMEKHSEFITEQYIDTLIDTARPAFFSGDPDTAFKLLDLAVELSGFTENELEEAWSLYQRGEYYYYAGDNEAAMEQYDASLKISKRIGYETGEANCYKSQGNVLFYSGDNEAALEKYDRAIPLYEKLNNPIGMANCFRSQGDVYLRIGDNQAALEKFEAALTLYKKAGNPLGEANCYRSQGEVLFYAGDNEAALEKFEAALALYEEAENPLGKANCYRNQADVLFYSGDNQAALKKFEAAMALYKKAQAPMGQANCYTGQGDVLFRTGDNQAALEKYDLALPLYQEAQDPLGEANCYKSQGDVFLRISDNEAALEKFDLALTLYKKIQNPLGQANCYKSQGDVLFYTGDSKAALEKFDLALTLYEKIQNPLGRANCYKSQGDVLFYTGDGQAALEKYDLAFPLFQKAQDPLGEANCYFSQGNVLIRTGDNQAALEKFARALSLFKQVEAPLGEANCYKSQGDVFLRTGDNKMALEKYEQALALFKKAQDPVGEANCYFSQGDVFFYSGDDQAALEKYERAFPLFKKAQDPLGEANCYKSQGDVLLKTGDNLAALEKFEQALSLYEKARVPLGEANCYQSQGDVLFYSGDNQAALEKYEQALNLYDRTNATLSLMWTHYSMGKVQRAMGRTDAALEAYETSMAQGRFLMSHAGGEEMQRGTMEKQTDIYEETIDLLLELGRDQDAMEVLEKMRGAVLRNMLEQGGVDALARAPEDVRNRAATLRIEMNTALNDLAIETQQPDAGDPGQIRMIKDRHARAAKELDTLMREAAAAYSGVAATGAGVPALSVDELRKQLPPGALLIEYFLGQNRPTVFALSRDGFVKKDLSCDADKIARLIKTFSLTNKNEDINTNALYNCLLAPLEQELQAAHMVLVSPDREVNYLPLDALRPKGGEYIFGPDKPLLYVLSGAMYVEDAKRAGTATRDFAQETVLALGGADFGSDAVGDGLKGGELLLDGVWERSAYSSLAELPGTIPEVEKIGDLFGQDARVLLESDATETNAKTGMSGRGIIHFSTHGLLNLNDPMSSALALSEIGMRVRGNAPPDDGFLTAREIMTDPRVNLQGGLAVLSACETGRGELSRSEGVIGLTRAFAVAGARAEIVSLWSVSDRSTSMLFRLFYQHLKNGEPPVTALAAAKQDLRTHIPDGETEPPWAAPFFWAPFIYVGAP